MPFKDRNKRNEYLRQWREDNPNSPLNGMLKHFYGMTLPEFNKRVEEQGGVCAISGMAPSGKRTRLSVDHRHKTGFNRGLLHQDINFAIGLFQENPEWLRKAADYIEYWRSRERRATARMGGETQARQKLPVSEDE